MKLRSPAHPLFFASAQIVNGAFDEMIEARRPDKIVDSSRFRLKHDTVRNPAEISCASLSCHCRLQRRLLDQTVEDRHDEHGDEHNGHAAEDGQRHRDHDVGSASG